MAKPNTDDTPVQLALEPDWSQGVQLTVEFSSAVQRSWAGRDQRQRKWEKPRLKIQYRRTGLTPAQAKARILEVRSETRQPIMGPVWPDGVPLQNAMTGAGATGALLDQNPVHDWEGIDTVWIWNRSLGGEFRSLTSVTGRTLVLGGSGTTYPAGAFVFPCRIMTRETSDQALEPINLETGTETVEFMTL